MIIEIFGMLLKKNYTRAILIVMTLICMIIVTGHIVPEQMGFETTDLLEKYPTTLEQETPAAIIALDRESVLKKLRKGLEVLKVKQARNKVNWYMSKGIDLIEYETILQKNIKDLECTVYAREIRNSLVNKIKNEILCENNVQLDLTLHYSKYYSKNLFHLTLLFNVNKNISIKSLHLLDSLKLPICFMINPFTEDTEIKADLKKLNYPHEVLLNLEMESNQYPYIKPRSRAVYIHQTTEQINSLISDAFQVFPNAIGISTMNGTRAIANNYVLQTMGKYLTNKNMTIVDLTRVDNHNLGEVCNEHRIRCYKLKHLKGDMTPQRLEKLITMTKKMGVHILSLDLNESNLNLLIRNVSRLVENGIRISPMSYNISN